MVTTPILSMGILFVGKPPVRVGWGKRAIRMVVVESTGEGLPLVVEADIGGDGLSARPPETGKLGVMLGVAEGESDALDDMGQAF